MTGVSRYRTNSDTDLLNIIARLEERISHLESGNRIGFTSLDNGQLAVSLNGQVVFSIGPTGGNGQEGFAFRRAEGSLVMSVFGNDPSGQFYAVWDRQGHVIMSDDAVSQQGLGRPFLPVIIQPSSNFSSLPFSSTSGSFAAIQTFSGLKQHPRILVFVQTQSDAATTGEIQVRDPATGIVVAGPNNIPASDNEYQQLIGSFVETGHMATFKYDLEIRRTGGAGAVRANTLLAYSLES